jgi:hypothetical protein
MSRKTIVYIDGFNLYYGALFGTQYKWLNRMELCKKLLSDDNEIIQIKYFTARVSARANDPDQPMRQETYFRALRTIPNLEIHFGHFLSHPKNMPLVNPKPGQSLYAKVLSTQEKGSDVNLASHLLFDGFKNKFEVATLITNDSDLYTPVKMVKEDLRKTVGILNPHAGNPTSQPSRQLRAAASFFKPIRTTVLQMSQFPVTLSDGKGSFHKPSVW